MSSSPLLSRILANSVAITNKSAQIARDIMASGDLGIEQKTDINDLQTKADRSIQDCIASSLRNNFPGLAIVGEEGEALHGEVPEDWIVTDADEEASKMVIPDEYKNTALEDFTIWIDPLDGTKEYTEGFLDHVTILVGIAVGDKAVAGVINQPFFNYEKKDGNMGRTLYGIVGSGVRGIQRKLPPSDQRILTTTRSHGTGLVNDVANLCKPTDIIRVGGAGHKVMLLIEGKAHAYVFPSPGCKKWDTCAPEAILHAMGGKLTDIYGNFYKYKVGVGKVNEHGTLATCVLEHHQEYLNLIPKEMKDQVKDYFKNRKQSKKPTPQLSRLLANSVAMTKKAAQIARDIMASGDLGIEQKTDINDLQTKADRSIQDCIASSLRKNFPGLAIVGEEGEALHGEVPEDWIVTDADEEASKMAIPDEYKDTPLEDFTVWIDPLDGTKEYTEGFLDHVTILVGIAVGDKAVAGVINQPFFNYEKKDGNMGRTLYGIVGSGVRGIERALPPADKRIITTTRSHGTGLVNDCANLCKPTDIIRVGGAGHKVMLLIEGKAHAYVFPSPGCKKWDTCAPEAILHAMGGKLTDIYGNFYKYKAGVGKVNEHGTLATCVLEHHEEYLNLIPKEMKDQVKDYFKNKKK